MKSKKFSISKNFKIPPYSNKAQLTMFIILGIVIISIFGFVFFTTGRIATQKSEQQSEQIVSELLETTSLKFYVTRCTEKALDNGIDILSKQGGKIFPGQTGSVQGVQEKSFFYSDKSNNKNYQVAYGITKGETSLPQYPCKVGFKNFNIAPAFCEYRATDQFSNLDIGITNMPRLCKNQFGGCSLREGWNPSFSVQSQLEYYISDFVEKCVDFKSLVGINESFVAKEGNASTNITFSDTDITAVVSFPVVISPPNQQPVIRFVSFTISTPTRFKQLYGLARDTVVSEVSSKTAKNFNIVQGFGNILTQRFGDEQSGFAIEKRDDVSFYDDFIRIIDLASNSKSVVQFMIENRPPVLEYFEPPKPKGSDPPEGCGQYDVVQVQNQLLRIQPEFFDPDEDQVTLNYSGWLEDYNETIGNEIVNALTHCVTSFSSQKKEYEKDPQGKPKPTQIRWIKDANFNKNGIASVLVTEADIGPHVLKVSVCDKQYCDYQIMRILIDDLLRIFVNKTNSYGNNIFSIEDPFKFTASIKDVYNPVDYSFKWLFQDASKNTLYTTEAEKQELALPLGTYSIETIKDAYKFNGVPLVKNTLYNIVADVIQGGQYSVRNNTEIIARECNPYRNAIPKPPFPYNLSDPYLSDHMCCEGSAAAPATIAVSGTSVSCFSKTTYGSYNSFKIGSYFTKYDENKGTPPPPTPGLTTIQQIKANIDTFKTTTDASNDIYKRSFVRNCDGTRGNICGGIMNEVYSLDTICTDLAPGEIARCSGPPIFPKKYTLTNTETTTKLSCVKYDKTTFEQLVGARTDSICNTQPKCVSNNNDINGFSSTGVLRYFCNATCGTNGCSQTLPSLCVNCYEKQSCSGPTSATPDAANTLSLQIFNQCSAASTPACQLTSQQVSDSCKPNSNNEVMIDLSCKSQALIANTNILYDSTEINCPVKYERGAEESDSGDDPNQAGYCKSWQKSLCQSSRCESNPPSSQVNDEPRKYISSLNKYVYREYYAKNLWGSASVKESCDFNDYDYDDLPQSFCTAAGFVWSGNQCCGDDLEPSCPSP